MPKNWCFWTVVLEKPLESLLDSKEIKPVNPKGNQFCIFIRRSDAEAPKLWPPDVKSWLIRKDPDAGNDWRQEEKGMTEDEMVGCITDSMDMSLSKLREVVKDRVAWSASVHGVAKSRTGLSGWTRSARCWPKKKKILKEGSNLVLMMEETHPFFVISSVQSLSHVQLCDPMDCSTPGFPVPTQTHVHWVGDAIQPSHPLSCEIFLLYIQIIIKLTYQQRSHFVPFSVMEDKS